MQMKIKQLKSTEVQSLREEILIDDQGGLCAICKKEVVRACLDHHHKKRIKGSGLVRGVLCSSCNVFLAKCENNCMRYGIGQENLPTILRSVADYLEAQQYPYMHPSEAPKIAKLKKSSYKKLAKQYAERYEGKLPPYPKSGTLIKALEKAYKICNLEPEYYA